MKKKQQAAPPYYPAFFCFLIWLRRPTKEEWEEIYQALPRSCVVSPQKKLYKLQFFLEGREIQGIRGKKICAGAAF
jgi:hypothetical protein